MAIRFAVASGNWSNTATWNGGTLPTSADDVFTNTFTVTVDQDITVITLRNTSNVSPAITAGGQFIVSGSSGTRTITTTNATQGIVTSGTSVGTCALLINSTLGMTVNINAIMANSLGSTCTFINGNCTVNLTGNLTNANASALVITASAVGGITNYLGTVIANTTDTFQISGGIGYTLNIIGNITANASFLRAFNTNLIYNQTGNITSTGSAGVIAILGTGGIATITGNVTSSGGVCVVGSSLINAVITINGNVTASLTSHAIDNISTSGLVTITGNITNVGNRMAVVAYNVRVSPSTAQTIQIADSGGGLRIFYANNLSNYPSVTDVRSGVIYAAGALTGSCAIPPTASVAFGVPVDNSTGSAMISRAQLYSDVGAIVAGYNT
jgi:hypothetical protein